MSYLAIGASILGSIISTYSSISAATAGAQMQEQLIRNQQLQLRLQQTQKSLTRIDQLRHTLATQQVMAAARNISPASGSFKSIQEQSFHSFDVDEHADALNFESQNIALEEKLAMVKINEQSSVLNAVGGFIGNIGSSLLSFARIPGTSAVQASEPAFGVGQKTLPAPAATGTLPSGLQINQ